MSDLHLTSERVWIWKGVEGVAIIDSLTLLQDRESWNKPRKQEHAFSLFINRWLFLISSDEMQCLSHEMLLLSYSAELGCFIFKTGGSNKQTSPPPLAPTMRMKWLENRNADVGRKVSYRWVIVFMSSRAQICFNATFTHVINLYLLPALSIELYGKAIGGMEKKLPHDFPQNLNLLSFHLLLATCCRLFPSWSVRQNFHTKKKKKRESGSYQQHIE